MRNRDQETGGFCSKIFYFFFGMKFRNWAVRGSEREASGRKAATWSGPTSRWISGLESGTENRASRDGVCVGLKLSRR